MSDSENVICGTHGETPATYVCQHLAGGIACGFHSDASAQDDPWPDAWCDRCEEALQAAGDEWTDDVAEVADIKLLCSHCYEDARARNREVPRLARGAAAGLTEKEAAELLHHAVHHTQAAQDRSNERWGWRDMPKWHFDNEASTLTFSDPATGKKAISDVRLVGSFSTRTNTFQWAWKTFDEDALEARDMSYVRVFGEVRNISMLTTANFPCDEATGWKMASIAAYLLGSEGAYRAPMEHVRWFMLLSNWRSPS